MLDLVFVRDNLQLVEAKLRSRGMDPAVVLGEFRQLDAERRQAITRSETLKAARNRASEEIARRKKNKEDAEELIAQTKHWREEIAEADKQADDFDVRLRATMAGIPNLPHDSVPAGTSAEQNVEV